ncbi:MAG: MmgE/PrpD family protein [Dehalobacterium sp.]
MEEKIDLHEIAKMVELDCATVSEKGKEGVRRAFADTICVSFPGLKEPVYQIFCDYAASLAPGKVSVPLLPNKLDAQPAAIAWGALGHAIDFDDSCPKLCGHPSVVLVPAILATAYQYRKSGKEALEAYISGYEATNRFAIGVSSPQYDRGWHTTTTIGIFGAVVAVARLLGLHVGQTKQALGLAASMAAGLQANFGTMTKPLHPGLTAANAIFAAEMAARGITSSPDAFDSAVSYFELYGGNFTPVPPERRFTDEGIIVKPYPSCGCTTRPNDLALELRNKYGVKPEDIESIVCRISILTHSCLRYVIPQNGMEAKFSLEYCLAKCLIGGAVQIGDFEDEYVRAQVGSEPMRPLMLKISRTIPDDLGKGVPFAEEYLELAVKLKDGRNLLLRAEQPKGFPANPLTENEFLKKFTGCVKPLLSNDECMELYDKLIHIDAQEDLAVLVDRVVALMNKINTKIRE